MKDNQTPIRVAHVIGKWLGGGVESMVMNYYRHLDRSKVQFDFICDDDSTNIPYEEIESLGGKVILIPPYQRLFSYQKQLQKILKEGKYRIIHSHINALSVFPLRAAKKINVPVRIAHSHSTTNKVEWKKNLMKQVLRPFSKIYATHYFCCSELAGRWLFGDKVYDEGKVVLINNAIDLSKYQYDPDMRKLKRDELGIDENTLVIGHIGRFVKQKNHDYLIDIFNELHKENSNSILLLAGQGPLKKEIEEKVKLLNLTESVKFLGQRNDTNELYQAMDIFLLPSLYEGLPVVGVEAQTAGLLCLFSNQMTRETKVLSSTFFLPIEVSPTLWKSQLLKCIEKYIRRDLSPQMRKKGFDIQIESKRIMDFYVKYDRG